MLLNPYKPINNMPEEDYRPKWMQREPTKRGRSVKKEKALAKKVKGGKTTVNSGATFRENDIRSEDMDIEHKFTDKGSYTITLATLEKLRKQTKGDRVPVLVIEFEQTGKAYAVVELGDLLNVK